MKRFLIAAVSLFFLVCSTAFAAADVSIIRTYVHPLILNASQNPKKLIIRGGASAVVIAPGYALSSWHVYKKAALNNMSVLFLQSGIGLHTTVVAKNEDADLVLISGKFQCPCAPLADDLPDVDTHIAYVGYPLFSRYGMQFVSQGHHQGLSVYGLLASTAFSVPGSSGGGTFFKQDGVWVLYGIINSIGSMQIGNTNVRVHQMLPQMSFATPLADIEDILKNIPGVTEDQ